MAADFYTDRTFFAPAFRIKLDGQDTDKEVIADVLEVNFTDDLENIDSFEFVLHDWDSIGLRPKYSSPWDENGSFLKLFPGGPDVPNFEPGAKVALHFGYLEDGDLPLIMEGEVVSLTPAFPASGTPTCRVRALDAFQRGLQKVLVEGSYTGTPKGIVDTLATENAIAIEWATLDEEGEEEEVEIEGILYDEIKTRAEAYGLKMMTIPGDPPTLYLAAPADDNAPPVAEFVWGRTLISFSPVLSAKSQVSEIVVRATNPDADDDDQAIEVVKTWSDIGLSPTALGPAGQADIETAVDGIREIIKPEDVHTPDAAARAALAHLRELAATLITGSGASIGLPELRAGQTIEIKDMGARFNGVWRLTQTSHAIAGAGYTTNFQCRKEVLDHG